MAFSFFSDLISPTSYKVPNAPSVDPTQNQLDTVSGNAASFASAKDLAQQYNDFMAGEVSKRLKTSFPQFEGLQTSGANDIADLLSGTFSGSDLAARQRSGVAHALGAGTNVVGTTLRDIGVSQQQAKAQGLAALPGFTSTVLGAKNAPLFDFSGTFLSAQQRFSQSIQNQENTWNVQNLRNQMAVQPEPWMKALAGLGDTGMNFGGILGSRALSGTGFPSSSFGGGSSGGQGGSPMYGDFGGGTGGFGTQAAAPASESGYSF